MRAVDEVVEVPEWLARLGGHHRAARTLTILSSPYPVLRRRGDGALLPERALHGVLRALTYTDRFSQHSSVKLARAFIDPGSLARLSESLVERWVELGMPEALDWAAWSHRLFGDLRSARVVLDLVSRMTGEGARELANRELLLTTLTGLGLVGESLLRALSRTSDAGLVEQIAALELRVRKERVFEDRALEQRLDSGVQQRVLEELGLARGMRAFELASGERVEVRVDEYGAATVSGCAAPERDDPRLDDPVFRSLWLSVYILEELLDARVRGFEAAMSSHARWTRGAWRVAFVEDEHLFVWAQAVIWASVVEGEPTQTFRVCEDTSLADVDDEVFELPPEALVEIAHSGSMSAQLRARWIERAWEYELVGPFGQLAQLPFDPMCDAEVRAFLANDWIGLELSRERVRARGWRVVSYPGYQSSYLAPTRDYFIARQLSLGGVFVVFARIEPRQDVLVTRQEVQLRARWGPPDHEQAVGLGELDPSALAELARELFLLQGSESD